MLIDCAIIRVKYILCSLPDVKVKFEDDSQLFALEKMKSVAATSYMC